MIWRFSDGTTVELGGKVEGATLLAQRLRFELAETQQITIWALPSPSIEFDKAAPALLDAFLARQLRFWVRVRGLHLTLERPEGIPPLPPPPWGNDSGEAGTVY